MLGDEGSSEELVVVVGKLGLGGRGMYVGGPNYMLSNRELCPYDFWMSIIKT